MQVNRTGRLTSSVISDDCENIQHGNNNQGNDAVASDLLDRVLDFVDDVEGVLEPSVREDDLVKCIRGTICSWRSLESIVKIGSWVVNPCFA